MPRGLSIEEGLEPFIGEGDLILGPVHIGETASEELLEIGGIEVVDVDDVGVFAGCEQGVLQVGIVPVRRWIHPEELGGIRNVLLQTFGEVFRG